MSGNFIQLVTEMRTVQKRYWNKKSYIDLEIMRELEKKVDAELKTLGKTQQDENKNFSLF